MNAEVVLGIQECYVCVGGEGSREVEHQFPKEPLPMCQRGVTPPAKKCPPRYKGCLTQYNDERVTRMCGELGLTICQEANNVKYCYCEGQLCNKEDRPPLEHTEHVTEDESEGGGGGGGDGGGGGGGTGGTSDDEDLSEGSGTGSDITSVIGHSTEIHSKSLPETTAKPKQPNNAFTIQKQSFFTIVKTIIIVLYINGIL